MTDRLLHAINSSDLKNCIISSEAFSFLQKKEISLLRSKISDSVTVKIIFYVRRQDEMAESRYNQIIRSSRYTEPFSTYISSKPQMNNLDYDMVLTPWREVFGLENMIVRVYEKQQLPDGIFSDFLGAMNTKLDNIYKIPPKNRNPSIDWDFIEIIRLCNKSCLRQNKFLPIHTLLIQIFEKMNFFDNTGKRFLLSPQQRRDLIEKFADSNEKVAREYLGRSDGRLFYSPPPDLNESWEPYQGLSAKKIPWIFMQLPFAIFAQILFIGNSKVQKFRKKTGGSGLY